MQTTDGRQRVVIEGVHPEIDGGRFPIKRVVGDSVVVEADIFADGHDAVAGAILYRRAEEPTWHEVPLTPLVNDRWRAAFSVSALGEYRYTLEAWMAPFATWASALAKRVEAGQDLAVDLQIGAGLVEAAVARAAAPAAPPAPASRPRGRMRTATLASPTRTDGQTSVPGGSDDDAPPMDVDLLRAHAERLRAGGARAVMDALSPELADLLARYPDRTHAARFERELPVWVDRERARFSTWYELFPRSTTDEPGVHGTFRDVVRRLPHIAGMGFDVLYLPPIHPIGRQYRKGPNNNVVSGRDDPGSPWAIGSDEGGHMAIHPELGTLADFRQLVDAAAQHGLEVALDIAFQASPDHPYVREHPSWFRARPDGTIQYAENPPKKYQDIYPFDFESADWSALWEELRGVFDYWIAQGVRIFRVDNPHTKPFAFWEWAIASIHREHPDVIFLAEAFTRPKVMYYLAKLGFTQSYTYFAWRNTRYELTEYLTELAQTDVREYFRPNLWPNTPDILTEPFVLSGRPTFLSRLVLAATLGASYGIYGRPYELLENRPFAVGSEEYRDSEKYEIKAWDRARPDTLRPFIARVNRIRREQAALQRDDTLRFHPTDNDQLIAYSKTTPDQTEVVLTVVNLDPNWAQAGTIALDLGALAIDAARPYQAHDLLTDAHYVWNGPRAYVELDPHVVPAHIFRLRRPVAVQADRYA